MKIFRVELLDESGMSLGFDYQSNKEEARKVLRDNAKKHDRKVDYTEIIETDLMIGKYEFLRYLNKYASHPDNG